MGCRCVIVDKETTKENAGQKLGIYLHWYGNKEAVESLLEEVKDKHPRGVLSDHQYGWARLCQIIADRLTKDCQESEFETARNDAYSTGIGIGIVSQLDCHNYDNGVWKIDDEFNIVEHTDGSEFD